MTPIGWFAIAPDDPCLDGHFPGYPVVPGVVVLDEAVALLCRRLGSAEPAEILISKFTGPVRPGDTVEVACTGRNGRRVSFACTIEGRTVASGTIDVAGDVK